MLYVSIIFNLTYYFFAWGSRSEEERREEAWDRNILKSMSDMPYHWRWLLKDNLDFVKRF